ncbi:MAG: TetR/AcrR family transcriptional regulator [Rhodobacteraceae bacterium]|nr:TetR/AcrR family transcriptional regulator [Paracoccaceae bacterium]
MDATTPPPVPRKLPRDARRKQLIEATIEVVAERGYARTTLTEVAKKAGLSHGLVNFHFQTKDALLTETLAYMSEEYRDNWGRALETAAAEPETQLDALIRADFNPEICTSNRLAAWCAFWGEASCRPLYQEKCGSNDDAYIALLERLSAALQAKTGQGGDAVVTARVIRVVMEGVWVDMMTQSTAYSRDEGLRTVHCAVAALFPQLFGPDGLRLG